MSNELTDLFPDLEEQMRRDEERAPLRLISRRPKVVYTNDPCGVCRKYFRALYRFAKSNKGPVLLCPDCAVPLQEEVFGKEDLMSYVETPGGFESNRRRH